MRLLAERNVDDGNAFVIMEEACKRALEEDESGSNYDPTKDDESSDYEEEVQAAKRPKTSAARSKCWHEKESSEEEGAAAATAAKRPKTSAARSKHSHEGESSEEEGAAAATAAKRHSESPAKRLHKRSHHTTRRCPVENCVFNGSNLRRHLTVHVKRGDVEEASVDRLLSIVATGRQRGSKQIRKGKKPLKGRFKKWCPVPGCDRVVLNVSRHLCNPTMHGMTKGSREVQRLVRMAKQYTGLAELDDALNTPPPPIVEERAPLDQNSNEDVSDEDNHEDDDLPSQEEQEEDDEEEDEEEGDEEEGDEEQHSSEVINEDDEEDEDDLDDHDDDDGHVFEDDQEDGHDDEDLASQGDKDEEDQEEDEEDQPRYEYFTDPKPQNNRHKWLVCFFEFLTRPSAGDKKQSIRLQHASQMRNLLEAIDPDGDDILCLLQDDGDVVWRAWVKPNLENNTYKPGTIISYLTSYEKFLGFVTHQLFNKKAPPLHGEDLEFFQVVMSDLKGWRSTVDSQSHAHKNKRFVDESDGLLTIQELDKIKRSMTYSEAQRVIIQAGQGKDSTLKEFLLARLPSHEVLTRHWYTPWPTE